MGARIAQYVQRDFGLNDQGITIRLIRGARKLLKSVQTYCRAQKDSYSMSIEGSLPGR
jgi:hypothetical protein